MRSLLEHELSELKSRISMISVQSESGIGSDSSTLTKTDSELSNGIDKSLRTVFSNIRNEYSNLGKENLELKAKIKNLEKACKGK